MTVILGGGLAGLAAAYRFSRAGTPSCVIEKSDTVGGLARTIEHQGHRFDLGGHRFLSDNPVITDLLSDVLGEDLLQVPRRSAILMRGRYFDYPLRPANAMFGLGLVTTGRIIRDYGIEKLRGLVRPRRSVSLEDWVVREFGRTMHEIYFKQYSEKVWGLDCTEISAEWVEKRIDGLSLWQAVLKGFARSRGKEFKTLADRFLFPRHGIGQLAENIHDAVRGVGEVRTGTEVAGVFHDGSRITGLELACGERTYRVNAREYLSSIPLTVLLARFRPAPPDAVLDAAARIAYRALVTATILLRRDRVTDQTWIYFPERTVPFGRIHEPRNWSPAMAPKGRTHLVVEYFCNEGDAIWGTDDATIAERTVEHLVRLGLVGAEDVVGHHVNRVSHAYPVFSVDYRDDRERVMAYLSSFGNLQCIGRTGMFRYLNMDAAMETGIAAAERILGSDPDRRHMPLQSQVLAR